jgi:hypothetical protein
VHLRERIEAIERRHAPSRGRGSGRYPHGVISTGLSDLDAALQGGLVCGAVHEWFGVAEGRDEGKEESDGATKPRSHEGKRRKNAVTQRRIAWTPPIAPLVHLAWRFLETALTPMRIVWIGDRCFPFPHVLIRGDGADRRLLDGSIFISPRNVNDRLWAIDLSLRSPAVGVVIADGSDLHMTATRRLQLVARSNDTPVLVVRPPWEQVELSAAQTRWLVRWEASPPYAMAPRWSVELMRSKGVHVGIHRSWVVEWNRVSCTLDLSAPLARQEGDAEAIAASKGRPRRYPQSA